MHEKSSSGVDQPSISTDGRWVAFVSTSTDLVPDLSATLGEIYVCDLVAGSLVWASQELSDPAGYSSCVTASLRGVRAITTVTASAAVGVRAVDGRLLWRYERGANRTANIATPVTRDGKIFYTPAYGTGCALLGLTAQDDIIQARELYFSRDMMNHHGGVVLVDGCLYGANGGNGGGYPVCLDFQTGNVLWNERDSDKRRVRKGSVCERQSADFSRSNRRAGHRPDRCRLRKVHGAVHGIRCGGGVGDGRGVAVL